jgi:hypothetical protein
MLGWRQLTRGQQLGGAFLLVLFVIASPMMIFLEPHVADKLALAARHSLWDHSCECGFPVA